MGPNELIEKFKDPDAFRESVANTWDIQLLAVNFPERKEELIQRILGDAKLFKKLVLHGENVKDLVRIFPEHKGDIGKTMLDNPEIFRQVVRSHADTYTVSSLFPERKDEIKQKIFANSEICRDLIFMYGVSAFVANYPDRKKEIVEMIIENSELFSDLILLRPTITISELNTEFPDYKDKIQKKIFTDPELFRALNKLKKIEELILVFPEEEDTIHELTQIYTQPAASLLISAIENNNVDLIIAMTTLVVGKHLNTTQDRELRNDLLNVISDSLKKDELNSQVRDVLSVLQDELSKIPVPSLLSTATLFVQKEKLMENKENRVPEELAEHAKIEAQDDLSKYFKKN